MSKQKRSVPRGQETTIHHIPTAALNSRPQQAYVDRWRGSRRQVVRESFEFYIDPPPAPAPSTSSQDQDPFGNDEGLHLPDEDSVFDTNGDEDEAGEDGDDGGEDEEAKAEYASLVCSQLSTRVLTSHVQV